MDIKINRRILQFGATLQEIRVLENSLNIIKDNLESQRRQMYKSIYAKLNMFFRRSKTPFAKNIRLGRVTDGIRTEDFCGRSSIKNFSWRLASLLLDESIICESVNTAFIHGIVITQKEIDELNEILSENLEIDFILDSKSFFLLVKK